MSLAGGYREELRLVLMAPGSRPVRGDGFPVEERAVAGRRDPECDRGDRTNFTIGTCSLCLGGAN
jgi:hypothetical protein